MTTTQFLQQIRDLIARDDLADALQQLRLLLDSSPKLDEAILQSARFQDIRKQIRLGTVSNAESNLTQNQIRAGLLDLLREIEEGIKGTRSQDIDRVTSSHPVNILREEMERAISIVNSKNVLVGSSITAGGNVEIGDRTIHTESPTSRRLRLFLFVFVPLLAIGAAFLWYRVQEMQRPLSLKIRVENQTRNGALPEPSAALSLTYGTKTDPKTSVVTETVFEGIPANFKGETVRLRFEAKGFVGVDTSFLLETEAPMNLPVRRNGDLARIVGIITDEAGMPMEGAKVSIITCCSALTDASGAFLLEIPFAAQRMSQRLDISKTGFVQKSVTTPVMPGEVLRQMLERVPHKR